MMRTLRDPLTIAAIGFNALGMLASAAEARQAGKAEAAQFTAQAAAEAVARNREQRDLEKAREQRLARTRALLAAGGGDTTVGTGLALLIDQRSESQEESRRALADSLLKERFLRTRASNARSAGNAKAFGSILRGIGGNLTTAANSRRRSPAPKRS